EHGHQAVAIQVGRVGKVCVHARISQGSWVGHRSAAQKLLQKEDSLTPSRAAPPYAPVVASLCLPAAWLTPLASAQSGPGPPSARRTARAPIASQTGTSGLHNAPFHYVIDKSRTACSDEGTVGEDLPSRIRSSKRVAPTLSIACLFNTHGPQAIGRSATI